MVGSRKFFTYYHLVCSAKLFAVASARKSARKVFRRWLELMVLKDHEFEVPHISPLCLSSMPHFSWAYHLVWGSEQ